MSFLPGYEFDIFISYAHVDNIILPGENKGWIEQFYQNLNLLLAKRFGRTDIVKIWWDNRKLDGSKLFDKSIEDGLQKSAILICLNSPGYMASEYCQKELTDFHQKIAQEPVGSAIGDRSRIFHVLLNRIPHQKWPSQLAGTSGFPFYITEESDDLGDTIDIKSAEFKTQMHSLRNSIWSILTDFNQQISKATEEIEAAEKPFTIYMGEVADTLRRPRMRIVSELEKKGFKVISGIPPPYEGPAHESATHTALEKADLAIHLLDEYPGSPIAGVNNMWYPLKQTALALETAKAQMIWVPPDLVYEDVEESDYKEFLQSLENGKGTQKEIEFVRCSKNTLVQEITDLADEIQSRRIAIKSSAEKLPILLDTHFNDQIYALDLCKSLIENQVQPYINAQDDDPRKNTSMLAERISMVKKLVFLYGSVSKEWVRERMSAALQIIVSNNFPVEDFYIYMGPPHKDNSEISMNQNFLKVNIFNNSNSQFIEPNLLSQFIHNLKGEKNG